LDLSKGKREVKWGSKHQLDVCIRREEALMEFHEARLGQTRRERPVCLKYGKGRCEKGDSCRFRHARGSHMRLKCVRDTVRINPSGTSGFTASAEAVAEHVPPLLVEDASPGAVAPPPLKALELVVRFCPISLVAKTLRFVNRTFRALSVETLRRFALEQQDDLVPYAFIPSDGLDYYGGGYDLDLVEVDREFFIYDATYNDIVAVPSLSVKCDAAARYGFGPVRGFVYRTSVWYMPFVKRLKFELHLDTSTMYDTQPELPDFYFNNKACIADSFPSGIDSMCFNLCRVPCLSRSISGFLARTLSDQAGKGGLPSWRSAGAESPFDQTILSKRRVQWNL
jgi:hypothetical protein